MRRLSPARCTRESMIKGTGNSARRPARLRLWRRAKITSCMGNQVVAHRLENLFGRGREHSGIAVDFNLQAAYPVHHKSGNIFETHLKLMRQVERFVVSDNAKRDVRLLEERFLRLLIRAELDFCDGFKGFHHVQGRAKAFVTISN